MLGDAVLGFVLFFLSLEFFLIFFGFCFWLSSVFCVSSSDLFFLFFLFVLRWRRSFLVSISRQFCIFLFYFVFFSFCALGRVPLVSHVFFSSFLFF